MLCRITLVTSLIVCLPGVVAAQDASLTPIYGAATLEAGFSNDPFDAPIKAGGPIEASAVGKACAGRISEAPDFRLTYTAGTSSPLIFQTFSKGDATLVVNTPDSHWYCDDDSGGDKNARIRFDAPQTGVYDVWVGVRGETPDLTSLLISGTPDGIAARYIRNMLVGGPAAGASQTPSGQP